MTRPIQKIFFGSPGTGKSHRIDKEIIPNDLGIHKTNNIVKTVFHPEYTYVDFVGKLVPLTKGGRVEYKFYSGHFLLALAQAYKNILAVADKHVQQLSEIPENVVLVIDEINRGNSASIFGTVFQLLDRSEDGWSSYSINFTELELLAILTLIGVETRIVEIKALGGVEYEYQFPNETHWVKDYLTFQDRVNCLKIDLKHRRIYIPNNLSILATMNTSDNSIYFMDSAFKRRWDWEFIEIEDSKQRNELAGCRILLYGQDKGEWCDFVDKLNFFIRSNYKVIRKIEDKQVGYRFVNEPIITEIEIKNKLMFFVWDSVFTNNKKPLVDLLGVLESELVTFGQFTIGEQVKNFVTKILNL